MSRFFKKQGFTLIELMVVIVIIGVLASLAIPRFSEASAKAKVAEAPRVLASYESAFLAAVTELPPSSVDAISASDLIFETPTDSKWFTYDANTPKQCSAKALGNMGSFIANDWIITGYSVDGGNFTHGQASADVVKKMIPNFIK
ncbi:MAG: type II secretion system GspH family protein [Chitinispirillales bacterium]|jgi:prepilin-type N-terminal cleavage/methylation domain-containing protein|nr:type II secretion system GspH family protein [Chitinispirillales bacterium]